MRHSNLFTNPVLAGFHPDPSICRADKDYYLVTSSFAYYPGLPIFYSADLVKWEQIGYAFDRPEQINLDGFSVSRGLFAPAIRYHNGTFYITCTLVGQGENFEDGKNFVITARNPKGPWSDPVWLPEIFGIDPSLFFDDEPGKEKACIIYNSLPPGNNPQHEGHRTIRMFEFDVQNLKVACDEKLLVDGGIDMSGKPIWIEGPHIFKKDDFYYLICAEGGTGYDHSEVVFRCKNVDGPYDPYKQKPILTQRTLDRLRQNPITSTGHADFVETKDGKWYAIFLACRPYEDDYYNTGRETFMAPVDWTDGWPVINPGNEEVKYGYSLLSDKKIKSTKKLNGNFYFKDEFDKGTLNIRYNFLRNVREQWYHIDPEKKSLSIKLRPETCAGNQNPSFIGFKQSHLKGYAAVSLLFETLLENEKAGLLIFQNENHFYFLCRSVQNNQPVVQLYKGPGNKNAGEQPEILVSKKIDVGAIANLKIEANRNTYSLYYTQKTKWILLKDNVDAKFLSTKIAGGFVGCMYAMYATSSGGPSLNTAYFNWFRYKGEDDIYKK